MELTPGELHEILKVFVESDLQELQLQVGDVSLSVSKNATSGLGALPVQSDRSSGALAPIPAVDVSGEDVEHPSPPLQEPVVDRTGLHELRSPLVGVFYRRPGPDQPPYVEIGDDVRVGDPVCTISVMKMFTEVASDRAGRVVDIRVENETLVEHGQVLMYIDPLEES